jgi:hypothetical protein
MHGFLLRLTPTVTSFFIGLFATSIWNWVTQDIGTLKEPVTKVQISVPETTFCKVWPAIIKRFDSFESIPKIEFLRFDNKYDLPYAEFQMTNNTPYTFSYVGYGIDSPIYELEFLVGNQWKEYKYGICGTGLTEVEIGPGKSCKFLVHIWNKERPMKTGIRFIESQTKTEIISWSDKVDGLP